jgi:hypothetical protein
MAPVRDNLGKRGPIDADGQIAQRVEGRPQHLQLLPQFIFKLSEDPANMQ